MRVTVDGAGDGRRLDAFLAAADVAPSVAAARRMIEAGLVRVDGRREKKGARVRAGQVVEVAPASVPAVLPPPPLELLYQDDDLLAVAKPAGVPSQSLRPGETGTVASALVARFPECAGASEDPREGGLAHRLDGETTGVLLAARNRETWLRLRAALGGGSEKIYRAEVTGAPFAPPPSPFVTRTAGGDWVVEAPIGRTGRRGTKVNVGGGRQPLEARTELAVLEPRVGTTLVEARLSRGRAHQVRAHLAHAGYPVVGDAVYGQETSSTHAELRLHALAVTLAHPTTGRPLRIEAPPPPWARVTGK
jgi:23S rRNA pseudouridine1911/1915/1917 synthase